MKSKKSSSRFTGSSDILHNKYVLYASFFFAILTAAGYLLSNNLEAICIFVLIGFLTTYFSKNMIVVLLVTTVATNFVVMMRNKNGSLIEGMDPNEDSKNKMTEEERKKKEEAAAAAAATADATADAVPDTKVGPGVTGKTLDILPKPARSEPSQAAPNAEASMEKFKTAEGLSNLSPAPVGSEGNSMLDLQKGLASGYGDQKEQIYKALSSLGGAGAAGTTSKMSSDTLNQQTEMINNLKS